MEATIKKWKDDKLGRSIEGNFLYKYLVNRYNIDSNRDFESLVLNINASWGFGKTFFLENWQKDLKESGHPTVFFNAWNSDFQNKPLIAFMTEIEKQLETYLSRAPKAKRQLKITFKGGARLLKNSIPLLSAILLKQLAGLSIEKVQEMFNGDEDFDLNALYSNTDKSSETSTENQELIKSFVSLLSMYGKESLEKYISQKNDISTFKTNFSKLVDYIGKNLKKKLPIFIIIDELDRCRPNYAIELLEQIKHIFNIKGVYFILATDTEQLCHSIKAIYGSEFNSSKYLNRFFDQTYEFQDPDYESFAEYLFLRYNISQFSFLYPLIKDPMPRLSEGPNAKIFAVYSKYFKLTLRDQEQVMNQFYTICLTWDSPDFKLHTVFLLFIIMLKHISNDEFERLKEHNGNLSHAKSLSEKFYEKFSKTIAFQEQSSTSNPKFTEVKIDTVIDFYSQLIVGTYDGISGLILQKNQNKWKDNFHKDIIFEFNNKIQGNLNFSGKMKDVFKLKRYFEIVKQTGQLTKEKDFQ